MPNRILTTHVGSLVRPPKLVKFLRAIEDGEDYDKEAYAACLQESIDEVVRQQVDAGIDFVSDGEFGKGINWAFYIQRRLSGIFHRDMTEDEKKDPALGPEGGPDREKFAEFYSEYEKIGFTKRRRTRVICNEPLRYTGQDQIQRDIANLKHAIDQVEVEGGFLPVVAPASALPNVKDEYYDPEGTGSEEKFLTGLAEALREEYRAVVDAGLKVQIDDAFLTTQYEKLVPPMTEDDYLHWVELRVNAINHALAGIPEENVRYHICWGSWNGPHEFDVPFKTIIKQVLRVNAGHYLFEAANPRHEHEWKVWKDVDLPDNKILVPGVVSHSTNVVEHPELVADRLERLANIVGRERVMAGTDCGFAQSPFLQRVHPSIVWAKLKALSDGAALATKRLWG